MTNLPSFGHSCLPIHTNLFNILWFSSQGKSRNIVYQRTWWFSWLIFVQHGLFGILLTVYSALSCLTDHGIYYITRCRIWLLTIFHIPYIHFQRELRKIIPPKLYLSFLFSICAIWRLGASTKCGDSYGHKLALLITGLFLYCYERDFWLTITHLNSITE